MAETEIRFKRNKITGLMLDPWGSRLTTIANNNNGAVFDNIFGLPIGLSNLLKYCNPWMNMKTGQLYVDGVCINPFIKTSGCLKLENSFNSEYIIHNLSLNYDNTLLINNNNQLSVNTNVIALSQVPLFTNSDNGSVRASSINNIVDDHTDTYWLGESNYWHPLKMLRIIGRGANQLHSITAYYSPNMRQSINFSPAFSLNPCIDMYNEEGIKIDLEPSRLNMIGGIKLSCGNILNATIPSSFGSRYYPIGLNSQKQAFTIMGMATNVVPGVVNLFGSSRSGIAIGENSILTDDISIDEQTLIVDLTEFSNYRVFEIPSGTKTFDKLVIYISKETVATEYIIVLDNRNNTEECIINSYEIATRDLELKDTFLPKDEVLSLEPQGWMFLKCNVVHQSTRDEHYAFLTLRYPN